LDSEGRARKTLQDMQELVRADQRPSADLKQLQAEVASRAAARVLAGQQLFAAKYQLGLTAGMSLDDIAVLSSPADDFPPVPDVLPDAAVNAAAASQLAYAHRADLAAARNQALAASQLVVGAKDALRSKIDLTASVGYTGLSEGDAFSRYFRPLFNEVPGGNIDIAINYQLPLLNNQALGQLAKTEATRQQADIQTKETERTIGGRVRVAVDTVQRSMEREKIAREAAALFESAVEDEREKLQLGLSTVIDLVLTEDRLTQSQLDEIDAESGYAEALAQLRFETGTILTDAADPAVDETTLATLPIR
jgi:outer membrane protein TolC